MKRYLLLSFFVFSFCSSKKTKIETNDNTASQLQITSTCPSDGTCTVIVEKDKSLQIKSDAFGSFYTQTEDNLGTSVISFTYSKNVPEGLQDAQYVEEVKFEIDSDVKTLQLENSELKKAKVIFSRFCFCRGQTGQFPLDAGKLIYENKNGKISSKLEFKNGKVPQIIDSIEFESK